MENKRYNFGGFQFSDKGYYVLKIEIQNYSNVGTSYSTAVEFELTTEERQELITNLITMNAKDNA